MKEFTFMMGWLHMFFIVLPFVSAKPNILLLVADDLGYGDLSCYGNTSVATPNIDGIARDGVKLTHHLTAASVCTPSRSAFLTGRYPIRTGMAPLGNMRVNLWPYSRCGLPASEVTFAELAKQAGYTNGLVGKWHLGLHDTYEGFEHHPLKQGFDHFYGLIGTNLDDFGGEKSHKIILLARPYWQFELFTVWAVTASAVWCWYKAGNLGFLPTILLIAAWAVPIIIAHLLMGNLAFLSNFMHRNYDMVEQPIRLAGLSQRFVKEGIEFMENSTQTGSPFLLMMSWVHMHTHIETGKEFEGRSKRGIYSDALMELDWSVGEMLGTLKRLGIDDNTLVYFTSDNGGHIEEGPLGGNNGVLKGGKTHGAPDGGIRVPGIVKWPGIVPNGTVNDEPTTQMDIYNLISSATGVAVPGERTIDGRNILPLLKGETQVSPHRFIYHYCGDKLHAVRYRPNLGGTTWKLVTHEPQLVPGTKLCSFGCVCNTATVLKTPLLYDVTSDLAEALPIDVNSETYREISDIILKEITRHKQSILPVDSMFEQRKLMPKLSWQKCCKGAFPFYCECIDEKYTD